MTKVIFISLFIYCIAISDSFESWLNIKNQYSTRFPVEQNNDGAFIEFLLDWINGPTGFWSQELLDRGFDDATCDNILCRWDYINNSDNILLSDEMYNENGVNSLKITANANRFIGVEQEIYYDDITKLDIYIYAKTNINSSQLIIQILSLENDILEEKSFEVDGNFKKYSFQSMSFPNNNKLKIRFGTMNTGEVIIDEASVMPDNNVNGIRKEIYDIFKRWQPGILRYPGGWHADLVFNKLEYAIGPIDKRKSPLKDGAYYQRMDFGYHEYFQFIESLGIEPHIVVNFAEGTAQEAANMVEYLNGNSNSEFGKIRAENGHIEPYNVTWWEIGNEQWGDVVDYSKRLSDYYNLMKAKDNTIKIISNGDIWQGLDHYNKMDSISSGKFDLYGYHPGMALDTNVVNSGEDTTKMGYLGLPFVFESYSHRLNDIIKQKGNNHQIGITEWSHFLSNISPAYNDLTRFTSQFQNGLYNAQMINFHIKNSDFLKMNEKTAHIGSIQREFLESNKRLIYPKPPVIVSEMIHNHIGEEVLQYNLTTTKYNAFGYENMIWVYDVPYIDVTVTASDDTTFIYIINRHIDDSAKVYINNNLNFSSDFGKLYTYYQTDLQAELTYDDLNAFNPTEKEILISNEYIFPPHSFSILALPTDNALSIPQKELLSSQIVTNNILETDINEPIKSIQIYDLSGNIIIDYELIENIPLKLNIEKLKIGTYVYYIQGNKENYKGKFLKTK